MVIFSSFNFPSWPKIGISKQAKRIPKVGLPFQAGPFNSPEIGIKPCARAFQEVFELTFVGVKGNYFGMVKGQGTSSYSNSFDFNFFPFQFDRDLPAYWLPRQANSKANQISLKFTYQVIIFGMDSLLLRRIKSWHFIIPLPF